MIRTIPLLCMAVILSGCASLTYPLPKCDGYSRRPLNRSLWQWEENKNLKQEHSDAGSVGAPTPPTASANVEYGIGPHAFAQLNVRASYQPCEA